MAPPSTDYQVENAMQRSLPDGGVRVHNDPDISFGTDRVYRLLQGRRAECQGTIAYLERGGRGKELSVLQ